VVEQELDRLLDLGIIKPVKLAEWAAPVMIVKKPDGSTRLCVDYSTGLNDALQLHQHPLPVPEDIFATFNGGQVFSQIDLSDAYLQVELDEESKQLCKHQYTPWSLRLPTSALRNQISARNLSRDNEQDSSGATIYDSIF
jgi:hypothetical protein